MRAQTNDLVFGDVDGDGDADLVLTQGFGSGNMDAVYLNDGAGTFVDATLTWPPSDRIVASQLALVDLDSDQDLDLLVADAGGGRLYLNGGEEHFVDASPERFEPMRNASAFAAADWDMDGDLDVLASTGSWLQASACATTYLHLNDGSGVFTRAPAFATGCNNALSLAAGDLDGDGASDVVLGNASIAYLYGSQPTENRVYMNNGAGGFTADPARLPIDEFESTALALGDMDGDGDLDLVVGNYDQQDRLFLNDGAGYFTDATALLMPEGRHLTEAVGLADVDADGDLDVLLGNYGEQTRLYINDGSGRLVDGTGDRMPVDSDLTRDLEVGDLDGDGDLDLVLGDDGRPATYLNNGAGVFLDFSSRIPMQVGHTWAVELGDVDEDGDLDLLLGNQHGLGAESQDRLFLNDGAAFFSDATAQRLRAGGAATTGLALIDIDSDRDLDLLRGVKWVSNASNLEDQVLINPHRQVRAPRLLILSRSYRVEVSSEPGYGSVDRYAALAFSFGLLASPLSNPMGFSGSLFLDSPLRFLPLLHLPASTGSAAIDLPVPLQPSLLGLSTYGQAAILGGPARELTGYVMDVFEY